MTREKRVRCALITAVVAVLIPLGCRVERASSESAAPLVFVEDSEWQIGVAPTNSTYEKTFLVVNNSGEPVQITRVKTTCGCTAAELAEPQIDPHAARELNVRLHPNGRTGPFYGYVALETDSQSYPVLTVNIRADFQMHDGFLVAFPPEVDFGDIVVGDTPAKTVSIARHGQGPLDVAAATVKGGHVDVTRREVTRGETVAVELSVRPATHPGPFEDTLAIRRGDRVNPELQLTVRGNFVPAIVAVPGTLLVNAGVGAGTAQNILVRHRNNRPFTISTVTLKPAGFPGTTNLAKLSDCQYQIEYTLPAESSAGFTKGSMELLIDGQACPLSIPIVAVGRERVANRRPQGG